MKRIGKLDTSVSVIPSPTSPTSPFAPFAITLCAVAFLSGVLVSSLLAQGELPPLEPIPSPAADGPTAELPSGQNTPTLADPNETLEPIPAEGPSDFTPVDDIDTSANSGAVEQASYEGSVVEGPALEGPSLEPIVDSNSNQPMVIGASDSQTINYETQPYQSQPIQLPPETSTSSVINNTTYNESIAIPNQPIIGQAYEQHPVVQQTYSQPASPQPAQPDCGCQQKGQSQPQVQVRVPHQVVVQPTQISTPQVQPAQVQPAQVQQRYYIRANPVSQNQQVNVAPNQNATRYYVSPQQHAVRVQQPTRVQQQVRVQQPARVQQVQYQQVPANPQRQVRPAGYQQVQVTETTETTRYRPVQVRVTETYRPQPRSTTIVVPAAPDYVPFQPFRNAVRRRW